jgi:hypothetical protein
MNRPLAGSRDPGQSSVRRHPLLFADIRGSTTIAADAASEVGLHVSAFERRMLIDRGRSDAIDVLAVPPPATGSGALRD